MNKYFLYIIIITSFLSVYFCYCDIIRFPKTQSGEIPYLKSFRNEFPQIKQLGFFTDVEFPAYVLYRIQNTITPVIVEENTNYNHIFCYSKKNSCQQFIKNSNAILLKQYNENMFLLQTMENLK